MKDLAQRFLQNPLLTPKAVKPGVAGLEVTCLLNPGVFSYLGKTWLIVRVAERPPQKEGIVSFPVLTPAGTQIIEIDANDPELITTDARVLNYKGADYLTTCSHLRLFCSDDGISFYEPDGYPLLTGFGALESFGIEDCRVAKISDVYHLTYTAVSAKGVAVAMRCTSNWKQFTTPVLILPPHNKDCAIFEEIINGYYYALHRPSSVEIGGNFIWIAQSPDGLHWGNHQCIIQTRPGHWDSARVGAGAAPIKTAKGWLHIYHGANEQHRYCLGAFLLALDNPSQVIARTVQPIMEPTEPYELQGFFGQVVFTNGHIADVVNDTITIYYGAADEFVCAAKFTVSSIMDMLEPV
jgi:predicted GH43/DUF377 family glycosyl hydrolase